MWAGEGVRVYVFLVREKAHVCCGGVGVSSSTRWLMNPPGLGERWESPLRGLAVLSGSLSAHLLEAWAGLDIAPPCGAARWDLWRHPEAGGLSGNMVMGKSGLGNLEGQSTPRASLRVHICVVPVSYPEEDPKCFPEVFLQHPNQPLNPPAILLLPLFQATKEDRQRPSP